MTGFLYHITLLFFYSYFPLTSLFKSKSRLWLKGRKNWKDILKDKTFREEKWTWFHCASLGEYEDVVAFMKLHRDNYPDIKILITFFSPSGYEVRKQNSLGDHVMYLPMDFYSNACYFVKNINLHSVFISRNDIWYNYLRVAKEAGIPLFHVSASIDEKSNFSFFPVKGFYKKAFSLFDLMFVQNETTKQILENEFSVSSVIVAGNLRVDAVTMKQNCASVVAAVENFVADKFCFIGGSLLPADVKVFLETYHCLKNEDMKFVLVPHEINEDEILTIIKETKGEAVRYSRISELKNSHKLLIVDTVGILPFLYRYSSVAFIGGGFNKIGIHNILEPCAFGNSIFTGPNTRDYSEAVYLNALKVLSIIHNGNDLADKVKNLKSNSFLMEQRALAAKSYVNLQSGAAQKILYKYKELI
jgi:3-deoxy-D-manno-octulosonic-acid transferase